MEPPLPITSTGDTIDSSTTTSDESSPKLRLMCSYGGHIVPRPHDKSLCYVGGDTRIVVVDRCTTLMSLVSRLSDLLLDGKPFALKYQLPSEDLDSLITVSTDEDLENMIDEYDRILRPGRLRIFLFGGSAKGAGSVVEAAKNGDWFVEALNGGLGAGMSGIGLRRGFSDPNSVNCLLGLEEKVIVESDQGKSRENGNGNSYQDVHSVPDSPMIDTTSSFGSTSSSPSNANVAPARVSGDDGGGGGEVRVSDQRIVGIEDQFSELRVGVDVQVKQDDDLVVMPAPVNAASVGARSEEYVNRVVSDDERSDQGVPMVYRKAAVAQNVQVMVSSQSQPKIAGGGGSDLPSPDSVARKPFLFLRFDCLLASFDALLVEFGCYGNHSVAVLDENSLI
ncbi:PAL OF QUIRKY-like protein [Drosera capensis]